MLVEFYLYIPQLNRFTESVQLQLDGRKHLLQQKSDLLDDIFSIRIELHPGQIQYSYVIGNESKEQKCDTISRYIGGQSIDREHNESAIFFVFDTPQQFEREDKLMRFITLKQTDMHNSILMFAQVNSSPQMLDGLMKFIQTNQFKHQQEQNLLHNLAKKVFSHLEVMLSCGCYEDILSKFDIFKNEWYLFDLVESSQILQEVYFNSTEDTQTRAFTEINEIKKKFNFVQLVRELSNNNSIFSLEDLVNEANSKIQIAEQHHELAKIQEDIYHEQMQTDNQNGLVLFKEVFKLFWEKCWQLQGKNNPHKALQFLLKFKHSMKEIIKQNHDSLKTMFLSCKNYQHKFQDFFMLLLKNIADFLDFYDPTGDALITLFEKIMTKEQTKQLFLAIVRGNNVILKINIEHFCENLADSFQNLKEIMKFYSIVQEYYKTLDLSKTMVLCYNGLVDQLPSEELSTAIGLVQQFIQSLKQFDTSNFSVSISDIEDQMRKIVAKKIDNASFSWLLDGINSIKNQKDYNEYLNILNQNLQTTIKLDEKNENNLFNLLKTISQKINIAKSQKSDFQVQILEVAIQEIQKIAFQKYTELKKTGVHLLSSYSLKLLLSLDKSSQLRAQILADLKIFIEKMQNFKILPIQNKIFTSKELEQIFVQFQDELKGSFSSFVKKHYDIISKYMQGREKLNNFFERFGEYLIEERDMFQTICLENVRLGETTQILENFNNLQMIINFYNNLHESKIFRNMLLFFESKHAHYEKSLNTLNRILKLTKDNLIQFIFLITNIELNLSNFTNESLPILTEYPIQYRQGQEDLQINLNLFRKGILTPRGLKSLAGQSFNESIDNIKFLLILVQVAFVDSISKTIESIAKVEFLQQQSQTLINLGQQFSLPQSQENNDFIVFLNSFQDPEINLARKPIDFFQSYAINCDFNLDNNFVGKFSFDKEIKKIEQLHEILEYSEKTLQNGSFLDLRDLIDDDDTECMSLLIKLDSLKQLLTTLQQVKLQYANINNQNPQKPNFTQLIKDLIEITRYYLNSADIVFDVDDCCKNFFKIQQASQSYEKKKSFITLTREIVKEGTFCFSLSAKDGRNVEIFVECQNKQYSEIEIRKICSRVILEQKTNAIIASSSEQKISDAKRLHGLQFEDSPNLDFDEQEFKKQETLKQLDEDINNFKEQWFLAEQLKDVFSQLLSFGNFYVLTQRKIYSNQDNRFQSTFQLMKEDNTQLLEKLKSWKQNIQSLIQKYPSFSLVGFRYYRRLSLYFSGFTKTLPHDLRQILNVMGYQNQQIEEPIKGQQGQSMNFFSSINELNTIASIVCANFKHSQKMQGSQKKNSGGSILKFSFSEIKDIIKFLVSKTSSLIRVPKYYQYFFYNSESDISDIELFFYRFQFLTIPNEQLEFFLIFSTKIDYDFFCASQELLVKLNSTQKKQNKLYILLLSQGNQHQNFSFIPEQSMDLQDEFMDNYTSDYFNDCNSKAKFYYSDYPGEGKTLTIQIAGVSNDTQVRVPTSNSENKADFLQTFQQNAKKLKKVESLHIDLYESETQDVNILLFELILLRSVSIHSERLQNIDPEVMIYIEVANTFQQKLRKSIYLFEIINKQKVQYNLQSFNFNHPFQSQKQKQNLVICYKYLSLLEKSGFQTSMNLESIRIFPIDQTDFTTPLNVALPSGQYSTFKLFLNKFVIDIIKASGSKPCFYQIHRFIDLFGFEMQKFEKCIFLQVKNLFKHHTSQGIRTKIVAMSYRLSIQISMSRSNINLMQLESNDRKEVIMDRISKNIEPFSKCVVNFVTFQEQELSSITTFFDKQSSVPESLKKLFSDYHLQMLFFEEENKPEDLLYWLILLINQNEKNMYKEDNNTGFSNLKQQQLKHFVKRITILKDNFFKIATLFMRIRSNTPLIIMGEAGIGKTILIELMSNIMEACFQIMIVHTGISDQQVVNFVNDGIKLQEEKKQRVVLFFDEVNTSKMIGGLFKEILIDRTMKGIKLPEQIIPIAAINPYKLKSETQKQMLNCQIHGGIKKEMVEKIASTDLEYMVEPLPESMYSLIWNYDSLSLEDEQKYISKMAQIKAQFQTKARQNSFDDNTQQCIAETIFMCQTHIRKEMGYSSSCSLRDVARFFNILYWLQSFLRICQDNNGLIDLKQQTACPCLAFYIVYCVRLPLTEQRQQFIKLCAKQMKQSRSDYEKIIDKTQQYLIDQCDVPSGIVKNSALKQNIFTLFISIINKIPVVLIGPPGSSKTLSIKILIQTMKGKNSHSPFFKKYQALIPLFYQGHMQSTSERILEVFQKATDKQERLEKEKNTDNYLSLVYFEEIGLADISPYNPLKVFHSTLENPKVAVVCISNWPLDQSKMNRMISIFRLNITEEELKETFLHIWNEFLQNSETSIQTALSVSLPQDLPASIAKVYTVYIANLKRDQPKFEQFHGMRDFYGMVKQFCYQEAKFMEKKLKGENQNQFKITQKDRICYAFQRHFSGLEQSQEILKEVLSQNICEDKQKPVFEDSLNLINTYLQEKQNSHYTPRHLMVITDNLPSTIQYISSKLLESGKAVKTLIGSEFSDDMDSERAYEKINEIISCVEQGTVLILSNLDTIYQSIYELLNQSYRNFNGKNYCKITFGSDSNKIEVSPFFKLIMIVDVNEVHRLDGPLINRFEKHFLSQSIFLTDADQFQVKDVQNYFYESKLTDLFRFNNLPEMINTLVVQKRFLSETAQNEELIQQLYHLVPLGKMIQANDPQDASYKKNLVQSNLHFDLNELIKQKIESSSAKKDKNVQLISIVTPSSFIKAFISFEFQVLQISAATSSKNLETKILDFFMEIYQGKSKHDQSILIIVFGHDEPASKVIFTQQKVAENIAHQRSNDQQIFVIIIVQVKDSFKMIPYMGKWELYYLEDLKPLHFIADTSLLEQLSIKNWFDNINLSISKQINFPYFLKYFLSFPENITTSYLRIKYKRISLGYQRTRIQQIQKIFDSISVENEIQYFSMKIILLKLQFILKEMNIQSLESFVQQYVIGQGFINQSQSLPNAIYKAFQNLFSRSLAFFLSVLEKNHLTYAYYQSNTRQYDYFSLLKTNTLEILQIKNHGNLEDVNQKGALEWNFQEQLSLETESKDFSLPICETVFENITRFLKNSKQSTNDCNLKTIVDQLLNLISSSEQEILLAFQEESYQDFLKYFQSGITKLDIEIVNQLIPSQGSESAFFFLKYFVCNYYFKKEIRMITNLLNAFYWIEDPCKICQGYTPECKQERNVKQYSRFLLEKIFFMVQPSNKLMENIKQNNIDFVTVIQFLIRFINSIEIEREDGVLNIKQQLIIMQNFFLLFVGNFQIDQQILGFVALDKINSLDISYIKDLKGKLLGINAKSSMEQSVLVGCQVIEDFQDSEESPRQKKTDKIFQSNWITFILDLLLSVVQAKYNERFEELCVQVVEYLCFIECDHLASSQTFTDKMVIQINLILSEVVKKCASEEQLIEFSLKNLKNNHTIQITSELTTLVLLSSCIQSIIVSNLLKKQETQSHLPQILTQTKDPHTLGNLSQAIYLAIFREITQISLDAIEQPTCHSFEKEMTTFFSSDIPEYLKIYIVKEFYNKYKEGQLIISKQKESKYFKNSFWLQKYAKSFTGLLSSQFLTSDQLQTFNRLFLNNSNLKEAIKTLFLEKLPKSNNIFGQIYTGNFNENMFYPFMMSNNISLFHRDTQNNKQLYQCNNCKEYIFSDKCPDLQSKTVCCRCYKQIAKENGNTIQVLKKANEKPYILQNITKSNQWLGYYIRLEQDQDMFKLDEGTQFDLRLFTIAYNLAFFHAFQIEKKYTQKKQITYSQPKNLKQTKTIILEEKTTQQEEITRLLKIHFQADPLGFLDEQIDYALQHISQIAKKILNINEDEMRIVIFKLLNDMILDQSIIGSNDIASRTNLNKRLSAVIQQTVKTSKQSLAAQNSSTVSIILEADLFNAASAPKEFKVNLRTTNNQMTFDQLKDYLKINLQNNNYLILKELLDLKQLSYVSKSLKVLVKFSQLMNKHLSKMFTIKQAQGLTLLEALQKDDSHPLFQFFYQELIPVWKEIRAYEKTFSIGCQTVPIQSIQLDTKLCNLVLSSDKQNGFFSNVLALLCDKQNHILLRILDHAKSEKQEQQNSDLLQFVEHLFEREEKTQNQEIEVKTIEQLNTELNIILSYDPDILSKYIINDVAYSKGRNLIWDLEGLQKELARQVISNTVKISLKESQMYPYLVEVTEINIFNIDIPQQPLSDQLKQQLESAIQSHEEGMDLLVKISTLFAIFRSERNSANLTLEQALLSIQINIPDGKVRNLFAVQLQLKHINGVIQILENKNMNQLIESCNPIYRSNIARSQLRKTIEFLNNSNILINFSNALGRFIIRCLSQTQESVNKNSKLFEQLFDSMTYEEFWDDPTVLDQLYPEAQKDETIIGQSYVLFHEIKKEIELQQYQKLKSNISIEEQFSQIRKPMMMESFHDKTLNLGRYQNQYKLQMV